MTEFQIRPVQEQDRAVFLSLCRRFYNSPAVLHPIPEAYHARSFEELMRDGPYLRGYLLLQRDTAAGYALLSLSYSAEAGGMVVWIEELYLEPAYQGLGAAHCFFQWLEKNIPAARYRLEVEADNLRAKKLYGTLGFRKLGYEQMIKGE